MFLLIWPSLRSVLPAEESQTDTQPSVLAMPSPARTLGTPTVPVKVEKSSEQPLKKAKTPCVEKPLAVKGAPTPKGSPTHGCLMTPPPKAPGHGVFTPTPPTRRYVAVAPPPTPSTKVEVPTPSMAARLRHVPIPRPSAKLERHLLPDLEVVCVLMMMTMQQHPRSQTLIAKWNVS